MNITRRSFRLGGIALLLGLIPRARAAAADGPADALTIGDTGNVTIKKDLVVEGDVSFSPRSGQRLNLYGKGYGIGIEAGGVYMRSGQHFTWYKGETKMMSLDANGLLDGAVEVKADAATLKKSLTVSGPVKINGKNTLEFGADVSVQQGDAGKIGYEALTPGALDIFGAGPSGARKIAFHADGGATLAGSLTVAGKGSYNVDLIVNGRLRSTYPDGGLWVGDGYDRFVGCNGGDKIGFYNEKAWRLNVHKNGYVEIPGSLFVGDGVIFKWGNIWRRLDAGYANAEPYWIVGRPWAGPSDIRFKTALRPISNALEKVLQLNGTCYRWGEAGLRHLTRHINDEFSAGPDATADDHQKVRDAERQKACQALSGDQIGLIAQELEAVVPELVHEDKEGYKYIRYPQLTALLVEAIKEQNAMIQSLSGRLAALGA